MGVVAQAPPRHGQARSDRLSGCVEVDESYVGGLGGPRGRSTTKKASIVIAAEEVGQVIGRIRMRRMPNAFADSLQVFVQHAIEPGTVVHRDGWNGYDRLKANGYSHRETLLRGEHEFACEVLPRVHRVVSLLKQWLLGTYQGAVSALHLDDYLDEYTFRFNRRTSRHRSKRFFRLVEQAVTVEPVPYARLITQGRSQRSRHHNRLRLRE